MAAEETTMRRIADLDAEIAKWRATSTMALLRVERLEEQRLLLLHPQESMPLEDEEMEDATTAPEDPTSAAPEEEKEDALANWTSIAAKYGVVHEPRDHQLKVLQAAMDGSDCIDITGPGSGKTLAYLIAALYRAEKQTKDEGLSSSSSSTGGPVHLVVSATTDLGKQQAQELQSILQSGGGGRVKFVPRPEYRPVADAKAAEAAKSKAADSAAGGGGGDADDDAGVCSSLEHKHKFGSVEAEVLLPTTDIRVVVCLPEDLAKEGFRYFLQQLVSEGRLTQISLDEVHLVDQWAKFRGSYRDLGQHLAVVREGLIGDHKNYRRPTILCLTGTSSPRQAQALAQSLQLSARKTVMFFSDLDRPHISYHVIDLNHMCDTLPEILKVGAEKAIDYIVGATKSIIFVATVREAYTIANFLNADKAFGITAFPFYSKLDDDAADPKSGATLDREKTLAEFESATSGVLVSTTLGTHGLNFVTVDLVVHATIRSDVRTYYQDICRAGRVGNESISVQIIHPLLLTHASWSVDFSNGEEVSALRSMVRIASFSRDCRRSCTLSELGSRPPIPSSCQDCGQLPSGNFPTCAACEADGSCTDDRHEVVDTTDAAIALLTLVKSRASKGEESWYTDTLRDSTWAGLVVHEHRKRSQDSTLRRRVLQCNRQRELTSNLGLALFVVASREERSTHLVAVVHPRRETPPAQPGEVLELGVPVERGVGEQVQHRVLPDFLERILLRLGGVGEASARRGDVDERGEHLEHIARSFDERKFVARHAHSACARLDAAEEHLLFSDDNACGQLQVVHGVHGHGAGLDVDERHSEELVREVLRGVADPAPDGVAAGSAEVEVLLYGVHNSHGRVALRLMPTADALLLRVLDV